MFVEWLICLLISLVIFLAVAAISKISTKWPSDEERAEGILVSSDPRSDVGISSGNAGYLGLWFDCDEVKPLDVDLGEFMNDVEEDADAATMLGGDGESDLDAEATGIVLSPESQAGGDSM